MKSIFLSLPFLATFFPSLSRSVFSRLKKGYDSGNCSVTRHPPASSLLPLHSPSLFFSRCLSLSLSLSPDPVAPALSLALVRLPTRLVLLSCEPVLFPRALSERPLSQSTKSSRPCFPP